MRSHAPPAAAICWHVAGAPPVPATHFAPDEHDTDWLFVNAHGCPGLANCTEAHIIVLVLHERPA
jgi:hypothetical protein